MKKLFGIILVFLLVFNLIGCKNASKETLYIFNFGDYISEDVLKQFEKEYNCIVNQDLFEANEEAQPILERNTAGYDLVCLSEYMIERLKGKDIFEEIDKSKISNYTNLDPEILKIMEIFDSNNTYAVPYFRGDVGICYNKSGLEKLGLPIPTEWADLWNPIYKGEIIMSSSIRDLFTAGAYKNNISSNTCNEEEIIKVFDDFIAQKPLVQGYFSDQAKEKILSGEALISLMLSGDMQYIYENGDGDYYYLIPNGPKNVFVDSWCMLKNSKNKELSYKFLNFLLRDDITRKNCEYVGYESVYANVSDNEYLEVKIQNKYIDNSTNVELERDLTPEAIKIYNREYNRIF